MSPSSLKTNHDSSSIVQLYLDAKCSRSITQDKYHSLVSLEPKADQAEKKLIRYLKSQIRSGKILHSKKGQ